MPGQKRPPRKDEKAFRSKDDSAGRETAAINRKSSSQKKMISPKLAAKLSWEENRMAEYGKVSRCCRKTKF